MDSCNAMALTQTVVIYAALTPDPVTLLDAQTPRDIADNQLRIKTAVGLSLMVGVGLAIMDKSWTPLLVTGTATLILGVSADILTRAQPIERNQS